MRPICSAGGARALFAGYIAELRAKGEACGLMKIRTAGGETRWWEYACSLRTEGAAAPLVRGLARDVTERKGAEEALREKEQMLSEAQRIAHIGSWAWDLTGPIKWTEEAYRIYGVSAQTFTPTVESLVDLIHPEDRPAKQRWIEACAAGEKPGELQFRALSPDGSVRILSGAGELTLGAENRPSRMTGTVQDITERKRANDELEKARALLQAVIDGTSDAVYVKDLAGRYLLFSAGAEAMSGKRAAQVLGQDDTSLFPPAQAAQVMAGDRKVIEGGGVATYEEVATLADGASHTVLSTKGPLFDANHQPFGLFGIARDITERKRVEAALRETTERLNVVIAGTQTGLWDWDLATDEVRYSREWKQLLGYAAHEVADHLDEWRRLAYPDDIGPTLAKVSAFLQQPVGGLDAEFRMRHKSGEYRWILSRAVVQFGDDGKPAHLLGLHIDLTERRRTEQSLRASEARVRAVLKALAEGVIFLNTEGVVEEANDATERILGYSSAALADPTTDPRSRVIRRDGTLFPVEEQPALVALRTGKAVSDVEMGAPKPDGTLRWLCVSSGPVRDEQGNLLGVVSSLFDITERKAAENRLREAGIRVRELSRRMMEIKDKTRRKINRELHDRVGANLAAINLSVSILRSQLSQESTRGAEARLKGLHELIEETTLQVRDLMADLHPPALDDYGLLAALRSYAARAGARVDVPVSVHGEECAPRLPLATETALFRVAQAALVNAFVHAHAGQIQVRLAASADAVTLVIEDDGVGFDPAQAAQAHPTWGLAIMRERAHAVGADFAVDAAPGRGTRVCVTVACANALE